MIDIQTIFCILEPHMWGNTDTHKTARRIADLLPIFRTACMPIYMIRYQPPGPPRDDHDFYLIEPRETDFSISKNVPSAFRTSPLKTTLESNGTSLLICGFDQSVCIHETAMDARNAGFPVTVLSDLTADGKATTPQRQQQCAQIMRDNGIVFSPSA